MKTLNQLAFGVVLLSSAFAAAAVSGPKKLKLDTLEFFAPANVSAFNIAGIAKSLDGEATFSAVGIDKLEVRIPVDALTTRMAMRDKHMDKRIFETKDGKRPDVVLSAAGVKCTDAGAGLKKCPVDGQLEIQGIKRPFKIELALKEGSAGATAEGEGIVKLSDYGIPQPEQLGVKVANEVKLKVKVLAQ